MNIRIVLRINAGVTLAIGLSLLIPLLLSLLYQDGSWESFLLPAVILIAVGGVGSWVTRLPRSSKAVGYVSNQDVYLSVTLT